MRRLAVLLIVLALCGLQPTTLDATAAEVGRRATCTLVGTPGDDRLVGTRGTDVICGLGGDDRLVGNGGEDVLRGQGGDDTLVGGGGDDLLSGASGDDRLSGSQGEDVLDAGPDDDVLVGGPGVDTLDGGTGQNSCDMTAGETQQTTCRYDFEGPTLVSLDISRTMYVPGDELVIRLRVVDATGVAYAAVTLTADGIQEDRMCGWEMRRVEGNAQDGTWELRCTLTTRARQGTWTVRPYARDLLGNWTNMNDGESSDLRGSFAVEGASTDSQGPTIDWLRTDRASYTVGDELVISAHVLDPAGVDYAAVSLSVDGKQDDHSCGWEMHLVDGTAEDGIWELRCRVPSSMRNGSWTVYPYARDAMSNWTNMNGQNPIPLRASFELSGASDDSAGPLITDLRTDRATYTVGDRLVISMHVADPSGVDYAAVTLSVGGKQDDQSCGWEMHRVSGTPEDGTWELSCTVPETMRIGRYSVNPYARDAASNWTNMNGQNPISLRTTFDII